MMDPESTERKACNQSRKGWEAGGGRRDVSNQLPSSTFFFFFLMNGLAQQFLGRSTLKNTAKVFFKFSLLSN